MIWESGPHVLQFGFALLALGLGFILSDPAPTFPGSTSWNWMATHGSEGRWGALYLIVGMLGLSGVFSHSQHIRILAAFVSSLGTGLLAWSFFISNPTGGGWWNYVVLTGLSYWLLWHRIYRYA